MRPFVDATALVVELIIYNRFVDRDMLMRYHKGLGVGHIYRPLEVDDKLLTCESRVPGSLVLPFFADPIIGAELMARDAPSNGEEQLEDAENAEGQRIAGGERGKENEKGEDEGVDGGEGEEEEEEGDDLGADNTSDDDSESSVDLEFNSMYGDPFDLDYVDYED